MKELNERKDQRGREAGGHGRQTDTLKNIHAQRQTSRQTEANARSKTQQILNTQTETYTQRHKDKLIGIHV